MTPQNNVPASLCDAARELIPAYAAGVADAEERALVERGLVECPDLADEMAAYNKLANGLLLSTTPVTAPAGLRSKILLAAAKTTPAAQPKPAAPVTTPAVSPLRRFLDSFFGPSLKLRPALAAAVLVLFVATNVFWLQRLQQQEQTPLESRLMNFIGTGEGATTQVNFQVQADAPQASLVYAKSGLQDRESWIGLFSVRNLPALEAGQTYQGWLMRGTDAPLSIGVFNVEADGTGWLIFEIGEPINNFEQVGITAEPAGGSPGPTTNPVLAGQL